MGNSALLKMITNGADWDIQREGRFTDPLDQSTSLDVEGKIQSARENGTDVGTYIMERLAFQASSPVNKEDDTLRSLSHDSILQNWSLLEEHNITQKTLGNPWLIFTMAQI